MPEPYTPEGPVAPPRPSDTDPQTEQDFLAYTAQHQDRAATAFEAFQYKLAYPENDLSYIEQNLDQFRKQAQADQTDFGRIAQQHPTLAKYIRDPDKAGLALQDSAFLTGAERFIGRTVPTGKTGPWDSWEYNKPSWMRSFIDAASAGISWSADKLAVMGYNALDSIVNITSGGTLKNSVFKQSADYWNKWALLQEPYVPWKRDYFGNSFRDSHWLTRGAATVLNGTAEMAPMAILGAGAGAAAEVGTGIAATEQQISQATARGVLWFNSLYSAPQIYEKAKAAGLGPGETAAAVAIGAPLVGKAMGFSPLGTAMGSRLAARSEQAAAMAAAGLTKGLPLAWMWGSRVGMDVLAGQVGLGAYQFTDAYVNEAVKGLAGQDPDFRDPALAFFRGFADPSMLGFHGVSILRQVGNYQRSKAELAPIRDFVKMLENAPDESRTAFRENALGDMVAQAGSTDTIFVPMSRYHEEAAKAGFDPRETAAKLHGDDGAAYDAALASHEDHLAIPVSRAVHLKSLGLLDLVKSDGTTDPKLMGFAELQRRSEAYQKAFDEAFQASLGAKGEQLPGADGVIYKTLQGLATSDPEAPNKIYATIKALQDQHPEMGAQEIFNALFKRGGDFGPRVEMDANPNDGLTFKDTESGLKLWMDPEDIFHEYPNSWVVSGFDLALENRSNAKYLEQIKSLEGKGYATRIYLEGLKAAQSAGKGWASDTRRSDATERMYARLQKLGLPFTLEKPGALLGVKELPLAPGTGEEARRYYLPADVLQKIDVGEIQKKLEEKYAEPLPGKVDTVPTEVENVIRAVDPGFTDKRWFAPFKEEQAKLDMQQAAKDAQAESRKRLADALAQGTRKFIPAEREKAQDAARAALRKDLAYRARHFWQKGELWDDHDGMAARLTHPETGKPLKLLSSEIDSLMGEGVAEQIKAANKGIVTDRPVEAGDVDAMANALGFAGSGTTGDPARRMLAGLRDMIPEGEYVKQLADLKLKEMFGGDLFGNPQGLMEAGLAAAHNEKSAALLQRVYREMAKSLDPTTRARSAMTEEMWRSAAAKIIDAKQLRDTDPEIFARAAKRHVERGLAAMDEGRSVVATNEVEGALLHHYLYEMAKDLHSDLGPKYAEIGRNALSTTLTRRLGYADPGDLANGTPPVYQPAHEALLTAIGVRTAPEGYAPPPDIMAQLTQRFEENSHEQWVSAGTTWSPDVIQNIISAGKHWSKLTPDEAAQVAAFAKNLHHVAKLAAQESAALNGAKIEAMREGIMQYVKGGKPGEPGPLPDESKPYPRYLSRTVQRMDEARGPLGFLAGPLDLARRIGAAIGYTKDSKLAPWNRTSELGPIGEKIYEAYREAGYARDKILTDFFLPWHEVHLKLDQLDGVHDEIPGAAEMLGLQSGADVDRMTRKDLLGLARYWGDEGGRGRLMKKYSLIPGRVEEAFAKYLTPEMLSLVQQEKDIVEQTLRPSKEAKHLERTGLRMEVAPPAKFTVTWKNPDGSSVAQEYAGGYHPIEYDRRPGRGTNWTAQFMTTNTKPTVPNGFYQPRTGLGGYPDFTKHDLPLHMLSVAHNLAFGDFVQDAARVLLDENVQRTVAAYQGDDAALGLKKWLSRVALDASGGVDQTFAQANGNRAVRSIRGLMVRATMAGNYPVLFAHMTHPLAVGEARYGPGYVTDYSLPAMRDVLKGYADSLSTGSNEIRELALSLSKELPHRASTGKEDISNWFFNRRWSELPDSPVARGLARADRLVADKLGMAHLRFMDDAFSTVIWTAEFRRQTDLGTPQEEAVRIADKEVNETMPTFSPMEQPEILANKASLAAPMMIYRGYYEKLWQILHDARYENVVRPALERKALGEDSYLLRGRDEMDVFLKNGTALMLALVIGAYLKGQGPEKREKTGEWALEHALYAPAELFPMGGELAHHVYETQQRHKKWAIALSNTYFGPLEHAANAGLTLMDARTPPEEKYMGLAKAGADLTGFPKPILNLGQFTLHGAQWFDKQDSVGQGTLNLGSNVLYPHRWGRGAAHQGSNPLSDAATLYQEANP